MAGALLSLALATLVTAPVPEVTDGQLTVQPLAGSLATAATRFVGEHSKPAWLGWTVPAHGSTGRVCCGSSRRSVCNLEHRGHGVTMHDDDPTSPWLLIMLRAENGTVGTIRIAGGHCALDAGGRPITWLQGISAEASIAFLGEVAVGRASGARDVDPDVAIVAVALHEHSDADAVLERLTTLEHPRGTREQAAFWLGHARGARGFDVVKRLLRDDIDSDFRAHLTFALSQSSESGAIDELLRLARGDRDPEVRQQALFWLAQEAGQRAVACLGAAIAEDPDLEVRTHALFALTQVHGGDGIPILMQVARGDYHPELRRQALFWLGQSGDPRALDYIEELITR